MKIFLQNLPINLFDNPGTELPSMVNILEPLRNPHNDTGRATKLPVPMIASGLKLFIISQLKFLKSSYHQFYQVTHHMPSQDGAS